MILNNITDNAIVSDLRSWTLTARQICDLELIINGAFSPLNGFLTEENYTNVVHNMRLMSGELWPIPIVLDVTDDFAAFVSEGIKIALRTPEGIILAVLTVSSIYRPNHIVEAERVFGTTDEAHPGVKVLMRQNNVNLGGIINAVTPVTHHDFTELRLGPKEVKTEIALRGWKNVVAFQTRNPMHRAHVELTLRAMKQVKAGLLLHPVVGLTKAGDVDHYTRVRCYREVLQTYPADSVMLALLPLAMRMAGPREAVWHALIRKNFGATHFIVGRDHAGPGKNKNGKDFYEPYAAQQLVQVHAAEIGIQLIAFEEMLYLASEQRYVSSSEVLPGQTVLSLSGTQFRAKLTAGEDIPEWYSPPEVVAELRKRYKPKSEQGFVLFFTGLSGAGKSTVANTVAARLLENGRRTVSLLDGDVVRQHLSKGLGFSKMDRDINIERIGYVAAEIARAGGIAICASISPYAKTRQTCRSFAEGHGVSFFEIYMDTSLEICEQRDCKGLYAKARNGKLKGMTGIDDPYEKPEMPELRINTTDMSVVESAEIIISTLRKAGHI
ncbi:bifunctional sulfate adenylyltransferase/adenylylsulfate kinase [Serratia sp. JSRIV001]|uniref:bifunctional sulfate adenylyltransferase/adenylylsulfate kinase n=1 Tax=unclassified Serratia (in: enterobacteria) TaxID=2647522 RepID=UPI001CBE857D|nr:MULTISPECIES: bifunctional sulfate adenylyltransferase/adenylylsulfate kinase [unclassified Serratia (in: enterobacteria)]UAN45206.1 bifunctional sulfate adenylyltransferase/adenylylsulfate kinase [Serratia sp. JSRIV001]UAN54520.1 bifunctional sulfate adenylyltransferase/adenylylsulfate kinase [Serratia sp. JSRIV002]UAN60532.1 bifunctional sulfate adenylyltransferase/adenylylsulfate kinase [Serratia sp. JSRIV004]